MTEKKLEQKLTKNVKSIGGIALKFYSQYNTGYPDRIVLLPGGVVYFVELKAPGKKPTAKQQMIHERLQELNLIVKIIDSEESLAEFIDTAKLASDTSALLLKHFNL
jgi:hypothetical protein